MYAKLGRSFPLLDARSRLFRQRHMEIRGRLCIIEYMSNIHRDLELLCLNAKKYGASGAAYMSSRGVVVDPRVRLKCMVPVCSSYGVSLMCPPNVMSVEEFRRVVNKFSHVVLVQYPIPLDEAFMASEFGGKPLAEIRDKGEYLKRIAESERAFMDLLCRIEKDAQGLGYRFATALSGGQCRLCDECVGQASGEACRHPFRARPAMEAVGIDVILTAKNAGLPIEFPAKDKPVWTGLLLVD